MKTKRTKIWVARADIPKTTSALRRAGFRPTPFQWLKSGQVTGLVLDLDSRIQIHARVFTDGRIESEVEVSRFYIEHHRWESVDASGNIAQLLRTSGIACTPAEVVPVTDYQAPPNLTDWRPFVLLGLSAIVIGLAAKGRVTVS